MITKLKNKKTSKKSQKSQLAQREHPAVKFELHPRNRHRDRYDFKLLMAANPELKAYVTPNIYNDDSVDFFNPDAVKALNKALLMAYYDLSFWEIPPQYLCPPIPGRADYIHHIAQLLGAKNAGKIPTGSAIRCLDIGVGANCVYPIIGVKEYGWSFVGSDIDPNALSNAAEIIEKNEILHNNVVLRQQEEPKDILFGVIREDEKFDLTICNPPFHTTASEAQAGTRRKVQNLTQKKIESPVLNFGGQQHELCYPGGESKFIAQMIRQSGYFSKNCCWFSTLISKQTHLKGAYEALRKVGAREVKTIPMGQGNKSSRLVAWTFLDVSSMENWATVRWQ